MKRIYFIAILATVIAGGTIFYACKKDNNELLTKTENITSEKAQKHIWARWVTETEYRTGGDGTCWRIVFDAGYDWNTGKLIATDFYR